MARPSPHRTMPGTWAAASSALGEQGVAHPYRACGGVAAVSGPPEGKETGLFPASAYGRRLKARVVPFGRTRPVPNPSCCPRPAGAKYGLLRDYVSAEPHLQPAWRAQITGWLVMDWSRF